MARSTHMKYLGFDLTLPAGQPRRALVQIGVSFVAFMFSVGLYFTLSALLGVL